MSDEGVLRRFGVVGEGEGARAVLGAAERAGLDTVEGGARAMAGDSSVDAIAAVGEPALLSLVRHGVSAAVLPIGPVSGVGAVPTGAAERGVGSLVADEFEVVEHPVLEASAPGDARALFDLTLVTEETARISEYTVRSGPATVRQFRADGVVVATPAGSPDYARAAGGPVLEAGTGTVSVVPISPFATDSDHWVLADDGVVLRVERDEAPVELLADGRAVGRVAPGENVRVQPVAAVRMVTVPEGRPPFDERNVPTDR
ncbi:ATP-NAD kinase [Halobacteriales archaeon QS_4_70_19]|nr:MAG: ATP-NAD kinase [Halobacteriales archaeon QS_4_70_19]